MDRVNGADVVSDHAFPFSTQTLVGKTLELTPPPADAPTGT
jgi:hypothetical protein